MSEKEYYNQLVLESYYNKLFDEEIEKEVLKPLKKCIINAFTGFSGGCFSGHSFVDDNDNKVKVIYEVIKNDEPQSLMEENNELKEYIKKLEQINAGYLKELIYYQETYKSHIVGSEYLGGV